NDDNEPRKSPRIAIRGLRLMKEKTMRAQAWHKRLMIVLGANAALLIAGPIQAQFLLCSKPRYGPCCPAPCGVAERAPETTPTTPKTGEEPAPTAAPAIEGMAAAPTPSPYDSGDLGGGALSTIDSAVGYIDNAIPGNLLRFRFDAAYNAN